MASWSSGLMTQELIRGSTQQGPWWQRFPCCLGSTWVKRSDSHSGSLLSSLGTLFSPRTGQGERSQWANMSPQVQSLYEALQVWCDRFSATLQKGTSRTSIETQGGVSQCLRQLPASTCMPRSGMTRHGIEPDFALGQLRMSSESCVRKLEFWFL